MPSRIRVLDSANRTMQRLGYLKLLCVLVNETETSNIASLGKRLIERVTKRVRLSSPLDEETTDYVKSRLTDGAYRDLRKAVLGGLQNPPVSMEIQDLYLADSVLPSRTGKLVKANWDRYPYLGTSLELIKKGTYSALTRSLVLLAVTPKEELAAFLEFDRVHNPLRLSDSQALVLLYCLIDNDAEVVLPLLRDLASLHHGRFDERTAGDLLPDILRLIVRKYRDRGGTVEERGRLALLTKVANSIDRWKGRAYTGGGARQEAVTVRLEPYCDLGLLKKPNRDKYEYETTNALRSLLARWENMAETEKFLQEQFFHTFAACRELDVQEADETEAVNSLVLAGHTLKSSLGYSPITDVGLLAGVKLLTENRQVLELSRTTELLKAFQKRDPNSIRFTVDRMGATAYVKFLKASPN